MAYHLRPLSKTAAIQILALLLVTLASSCQETGIAETGTSSGKAELGYGADKAIAVSDTEIPSVLAEVASLDSVLRLTGTIEPDEKSEVASSADGIILEIPVERGSLVEKGDLLARVDPRDAQNALDQGRAALEELKAALGWDDSQGPFQVNQQPSVKAAKIDLDLAKTNYDRYASMFNSHAISKQLLDQNRTQYETMLQKHQQTLLQAKQLYKTYLSSMLRIRSLQKALDDTTIVAPFSGWVATKYVSVGERVTINPMGAGAKILSLVRIDPLRLTLSVPQQFATQVHVGQQIQFTVESFTDKSFSAQVKYIGPSLENGSHALTIEAIVPNSEKLLRPGFFVSAELTVPGERERVAIPASAVVKSNDGLLVYVRENNQTVARIIAVDETRGERAFVKSGLAAGDRIILAPEKLVTTPAPFK